MVSGEQEQLRGLVRRQAQLLRWVEGLGREECIDGLAQRAASFATQHLGCDEVLTHHRYTPHRQRAFHFFTFSLAHPPPPSLLPPLPR